MPTWAIVIDHNNCFEYYSKEAAEYSLREYRYSPRFCKATTHCDYSSTWKVRPIKFVVRNNVYFRVIL